MSEVRGKAIHKQCGLLAIDETVPNLACFYKKPVQFYAQSYNQSYKIVIGMGIATKKCIAIYCDKRGRIAICVTIYWDSVKSTI